MSLGLTIHFKLPKPSTYQAHVGTELDTMPTDVTPLSIVNCTCSCTRASRIPPKAVSFSGVTVPTGDSKPEGTGAVLTHPPLFLPLSALSSLDLMSFSSLFITAISPWSFSISSSLDFKELLSSLRWTELSCSVLLRVLMTMVWSEKFASISSSIVGLKLKKGVWGGAPPRKANRSLSLPIAPYRRLSPPIACVGV